MNQFYNYEYDHVQQRIELFKILSTITKKRQTRPVLIQFGIHSNRFYQLKENTLFLYPLYKPQYHFRSIDKKVSCSRECSVVYSQEMAVETIFDLK